MKKIVPVVKICPVCGLPYDGYPALSRRDNKTEICPECGVMEAIEDYYSALKKSGCNRLKGGSE